MSADVAMPRTSLKQTAQHILIVHAGSSAYGDLRRACDDAGYAAVEAQGYEEALACLQDLQPALVLLQAGAGDDGGLAICRALRGSETPVLVLLDTADPITVTEVLAAGASDCLLMPVEWPLLRHRINDQLERQRLRAYVATSLARIQSITEHTPDGILIVNPTGRIEFANPAVEHLFGYTPAEITGEPLHRLFPTVDVISTLRAEQRSDVVGCRKDGRSLQVEIGVSYFVVSDATYYSLIVRHDSRRDQVESALRQSEAKFRALAESTSAGVLIFQEDRFVYANPAAVALSGFDEAELLSMRYWEQIHPDFQATALRRGGEHLTEGTHPAYYEFKIVTKAGEPRWILASAASITLEDKPAVVGTFIDITRRKQAEEIAVEQRTLAEALRDTAAALNSTLRLDELLQRILTNLSRVVPFDACNILMMDGDTAYVASSLGYEPFMRANDVRGLRFPVSELPNLQEMLSGRWVVIPDVAADPHWVPIPEARWLRSYAGAPVQSNGRVIGFLSLDSATPGFFDAAHAERLQAFADQAGIAITNARLYEAVSRHAADLEARVRERTAALETANKQLRELDRLKSEFVSNVSHELRTPLTNIKLYLSLLQGGKPERQAHYQAILQREADFVQRMIEALLDLSRLDLGTLDVSFSEVDLNHLVHLAVQRVESQRAARGFDLSIDLLPDLPAVRADPQLLNRVLSALLDNAFDYSADGGRIVLGTVQTQRNHDTWVGLSVKDSGPGISPEDRAHLFERFFRGQAGHQKPHFGTGLGLALAYEIVERHGGEITVETQPGQGSTFTVWLKARHD